MNLNNTLHFDIRELTDFKERIKKLSHDNFTRFLSRETNKLATRLMKDAVKFTPVGHYPTKSGKQGGTLKGGWRKTGATPTTLTANVFNSTEYAMYVEYGHRTRGSAKWVEGQAMLGKAEYEMMYGKNSVMDIISADLDRFIQKMMEE